eukprot:GDKH01007631.1.p3 GENE.GDKH01007631.1~~GDKH01007631.1.p3  ORF type:complete len:67 (+),score=1.69 GDKH01007631.1:465-665(+)
MTKRMNTPHHTGNINTHEGFSHHTNAQIRTHTHTQRTQRNTLADIIQRTTQQRSNSASKQGDRLKH